MLDDEEASICFPCTGIFSIFRRLKGSINMTSKLISLQKHFELKFKYGIIRVSELNTKASTDIASKKSPIVETKKGALDYPQNNPHIHNPKNKN